MTCPHSTCTNADCPRYEKLLTDRKEYRGHLYTRTRGVLPVQITTVYCRGIVYYLTSSMIIMLTSLGVPGCRTTYRPNYAVRDAQAVEAKRVYYEGVPEIFEAAEHAFVDRDLITLFRAQMAFGQFVVSRSMLWLSTANSRLLSASADVIARIYNVGVSSQNAGHNLTPEVVWHVFHLHALLDWKHRRSERLEVPHHCVET